MMPTVNQAREGAQPTRWSLVARVHEGSDEARMEALGELLQRYLPVLHWYLSRHPGLDAHRREDLVQGFVASKILEQSILERADRSRGRFRTFLLNAFQNYIRDELRRASAARRTPPGGALLPYEEADGVAAGDSDMDRKFHRAWVGQVVAMAVQGMQAECDKNDRADVWTIFQRRLLEPMLEGARPVSYGDLVKELKLESPSQAANLLITAKRMFSRHLHTVVSETVEDPAQAEAELQELKKCL